MHSGLGQWLLFVLGFGCGALACIVVRERVAECQRKRDRRNNIVRW